MISNTKLPHSYVTYNNEDAVIAEALKILDSRLHKPHVWLNEPEESKAYCMLQLAQYGEEHFCVAFLNNHMGLIEFKDMFKGTVNEVEVPVREIAKEALLTKSSCVVLCHNHPSGEAWPSEADVTLTNLISEALNLFHIEVIDHLIVAKDKVFSFKEDGLLPA